MKRLPFVLLISGLTGMLTLGLIWAPAAEAGSKGKFTVEVAMGDLDSGINPSTTGFPRGVVVLASGKIFPEDTLPEGPSMENPNGPGGPDPIGSWFCHFIHLGPGEFPLVGAVTYFFKLDGTGKKGKESMIIARGLNSHTGDYLDSVPRVLAVVGGTGEYIGATGEVREVVIGTNITATDKVARNLRFEFRLGGKKGF